MAHKMVNAVKTLGAILLCHGPEFYPIRDKMLYIGLCVRRIPAKHGVGLVDDERLIKLYNQCGFHKRDEDTPTFGYKSFTSCSRYNWDLDYDPKAMTPMWIKVD